MARNQKYDYVTFHLTRRSKRRVYDELRILHMSFPGFMRHLIQSHFFKKYGEDILTAEKMEGRNEWKRNPSRDYRLKKTKDA